MLTQSPTAEIPTLDPRISQLQQRSNALLGSAWASLASPQTIQRAQLQQTAQAPQATGYAAELEKLNQQNAPADWKSIQQGIFAGESGGDYNALFGFSNRDGGQFANTKLTDMTVNQALAFSDPSGPYGQWVKGQIGRVATPMGGYQIVGTTLRAAKEGLGLSGNERMSEATQDQLGQWILKTQGTGAWEGYRGPVNNG